MHINQEVFVQSKKLVVNHSFKENHLNIITGPNGVGKSTLLNHFNQNIESLFTGKTVSFLFQFPLNPINQITPRILFDLLKEDFKARMQTGDFSILHLAKLFQFEDKLDIPINSLSGGENQIVKIILCFSLKSDFYFLDEPTTYLDTERKKIFFDLLFILSQNATIFMVEHDWAAITQSFDRYHLTQFNSELKMEHIQ